MGLLKWRDVLVFFPQAQSSDERLNVGGRVRVRRGGGSVRMLAQPRKTPPAKTVQVFCKKCTQVLYKYHKGGTGSLVKCWVERIAEDYTKEQCTCPKCNTVFARPTMIRGRPAYKMIGGKVFMRK